MRGEDTSAYRRETNREEDCEREIKWVEEIFWAIEDWLLISSLMDTVNLGFSIYIRFLFSSINLMISFLHFPVAFTGLYLKLSLNKSRAFTFKIHEIFRCFMDVYLYKR